jgi:hypothetical protein
MSGIFGESLEKQDASLYLPNRVEASQGFFDRPGQKWQTTPLSET